MQSYIFYTIVPRKANSWTVLCLAPWGMRVLFGKVYCPCLTDDGDLDLAWILQVLLHCFGYVFREMNSGQVVDLLWLDDDSDFSPCLDGIGFIDAIKGIGHFFQGSDTLDIGLQRLPSGTRSRTRYGIGGFDDDRFQRFGLGLAVV